MIYKLKYSKRKKAYLATDFIFAILIFFLILFTIYSQIVAANESKEEVNSQVRLKNEATDICKLLVSTQGLPKNWDTSLSSLQFPGLLSSDNVTLSQNKVESFNNSNYFTIKDSLGVKSNLFIEIEGISNDTSYISFGSKPSIENRKAFSQCFSTYQSEIVKVEVLTWQ